MAHDRYAAMNNNPLNYNDPTGHWPEWADYLLGIACQFTDDMSLGTFSAISGSLDNNPSDAFQSGREDGRFLSTVVASTEQVVGAAAFAAGLTSMGPTGGGALAAALPTGGTSLVVGGVAITGEVAVTVGGAALGLHGGLVAAFSNRNPVANKAKGDKYRDQVASEFEKNGYGVKKEVVKKTPFGPRRIDVEVYSPEGKLLGGVETKTGKSIYTFSQRAKDTWLSWQGYIVNVMREK